MRIVVTACTTLGNLPCSILKQSAVETLHQPICTGCLGHSRGNALAVAWLDRPLFKPCMQTGGAYPLPQHCPLGAVCRTLVSPTCSTCPLPRYGNLAGVARSSTVALPFCLLFHPLEKNGVPRRVSMGLKLLTHFPYIHLFMVQKFIYGPMVE